ncbi:MAG: decarboxylating 6-phosphogluconate dehydrogenase [DPANN group archaeon]|nr:decarboxylating 6-phosphogluconate dehydrogenase [DPANN group archaeon]
MGRNLLKSSWNVMVVTGISEVERMRIGFIGLGKMGHNMVLNLIDRKHEVVAYNRSPDKTRDIAKKGAIAAFSYEELMEKLPSPRVVWLMVSHTAVDKVIADLLGHMEKGDLIIDGGNSFYKDTQRRSKLLAEAGISYMDCGTSGGLEGARNGACLMVGGKKSLFKKYEKLFRDLAMKDGYFHCGDVGAGHYVKMIHNGVEYAVMHAYGEGFELLKDGEYENLDLHGIARVWNHGSIVQSFLLEKLEDALKKDPKLDRLRDYVDDSGEGRWTVQTAIEQGVPLELASLALFARFRSRQGESFSMKTLAAMRNEFGGHAVKKK